MDVLNQLAMQLRSFWRSSSFATRVTTVVTTSGLIAVVVAAAIWSSIPDFKLLRDGLSPVMTAEIVSTLDKSGIPNQMNYSGTGVSVPTSRWNEANIAIANLGIAESMAPTPGADGLLFQRPPGHAEEIRGKEIALERSILKLRMVKSVSVNLGIPEPSPFRNNRRPATASVVAEAEPNQVISRETAKSIIHMVAAAVEGLEPKNVTLANSEGTIFGDLANSDPVTNRRQYVGELEAGLAMKAQDLLAAVLGPNKSVVRVTAVVDDYTDRTITETKIQADEKVRLTERITTSDQTGAPLPAAGVAGVGSNGAGVTLQNGAGQQTTGREETNDTTYDYPRTTETTKKVGGQTLQLSISAAVDVTSDAPTVDGQGPVQALTQQEVEGIIKTAVGFDQSRGDQIQVVLTEFTDLPPEVLTSLPDATQWKLVSELARNASLGLAAVVALLIGTMTIRKLHPIKIEAENRDQRRSDLLADLSSRVDENPAAVSKILAAWLGQEDASADRPMNKAA